MASVPLAFAENMQKKNYVRRKGLMVKCFNLEEKGIIKCLNRGRFFKKKLFCHVASPKLVMVAKDSVSNCDLVHFLDRKSTHIYHMSNST